MYSLLRPLLFCLEPEHAHHAGMRALELAHKLGICRLIAGGATDTPLQLMGLKFPNRVGLAAGLDKNGDHIDALAALGFGFVEVGTVTPRPQPGNPRPRMFRLPEANAIINRLGFNNLGVDYMVANLRRIRFRGVLGVNIGKNFDTPINAAEGDYLLCLERVYAYASYVTINISSPNATNTTLSRRGVEGLAHADEAGGLSGAPVFGPSNRVIRLLSRELRGQVPVIGAGGILSGNDAREKLAAGASLVQVYSGLIYRGPQLISDIRRTLATARTAA
ncbi:MAG: dihydroorotate dehydrogenase (quinone) [Proteobacteria bacterium]|nr:dihydroorotate dehydrogenase (quinone) [Pseudomonadota bacterium]